MFDDCKKPPELDEGVCLAEENTLEEINGVIELIREEGEDYPGELMVWKVARWWSRAQAKGLIQYTTD